MSGNIERDDFDIVRKTMKDGTVREVKKRLQGNNVKELVRKMRFSIPLTKLLATDTTVREYLLYCALHVQSLLGKTVYLPAEVVRRELTEEEWANLGDRLAGT